MSIMTASAALGVHPAGRNRAPAQCSLSLRWWPALKGGPIDDPQHQTVSGMSGSPIITEDDHAIGVVCTGLEMMDLMQNQRIKQSDGPHARLMRSLPAWMLAAAVPER
jgi:hypothetical protein